MNIWPALEGWIPIFVLIGVAQAIGVYFYIVDRRLVEKWFHENPRYIVEDSSFMKFRWLSRSDPIVIAMDNETGNRVEISLRVQCRWFSGTALNSALCEGIRIVTPVERNHR